MSEMLTLGSGGNVGREARLSGMARRPAALEAVERRRVEVSVIAAGVLVLAAIGLALSFAFPGASIIPPSVLRWALLLLALGVTAYAAEKETHLRRLTKLLVEERASSLALSRRLQEISALSKVGAAVNSAGGFGEVLRVIASTAVGLVGATGGWIVRLSDADWPGGDEAYTIGGVDDGLLRANDRSVAAAIAARAARVVDLDPRHDAAVGQLLVVPIINREDVLGAIAVVSGPDRVFGEYDERVLTLFAQQAAVWIANARLRWAGTTTGTVR